MLHLSAYQRYFLYSGDTNMRKSFDSLSGMVTTLLQQNVLSGDIFIFVNKRRNQIKLLAQIVIDKYVDHLPLHRQQQRFARENVNFPYSTITDWVSVTCKLITPLYDALQKEVLASDYLHVDETPIKVLDRDKKGETHRGYYWGTITVSKTWCCLTTSLEEEERGLLECSKILPDTFKGMVTLHTTSLRISKV